MNRILIGNGPSCLNQKLGEKIDKFDKVIRFNNFRTEGYEEYVGTKTDIWVVHEGIHDGRIIWNHKFPQPVTLVVTPYRKHDSNSWSDVLRSISDKEYFISKKIARKMTELFGENPWPSSGALALELFKPCSTLGFDHFRDKTHYFDDKTFYGHSPDLEETYFNSLVELGLVRVLI